ncbi:hypothetical protein FWC63_00200 [Candidatus Saccharibacteria bacterium]|nr:hypothetical protein [Candidatus Saccharibacteria bacterium]
MFIFSSLFGYRAHPKCLNRHKPTAGFHPIVVFDFGLEDNESSTNAELAKFILDLPDLAKRKIYAQTITYNLLAKSGKIPTHNLHELPSKGARSLGQADSDGNPGDSYQNWEVASGLISGADTVVVIAQKYHAGRVEWQGQLFGFHPLLPPGLPSTFSRRDPQFWVRNLFFWLIREIPGRIVLRAKRKF